ncbi:MAG: tetratricopeptide repeat protein [Betaproteobacteria bacterium]
MSRLAALLLSLAFAGVAAAQSPPQLARQAMGGNHAAKDKLEALAGSGDVLAQHYMGQLYLRGGAVPRNDERAVEWFRRAAEKGDAASAHNLGVIHERAAGALRDREQALKWYRLAAAQGFARAQANLGQLLSQDKDPEARQWIEKAAAQKEPRGLYLLGMVHLNEGEDAQAAMFFRQAAEAKDRNAQYRLSLLYGTGRGVEKDDRQALEWLRRAAEQRQADAQYALAAVYSRGLYGVARDDVAAAEWLKRAARLGNVEAQYALANAYAEGRGVPLDANEALGWIQLAAKNNHPQAGAALERIRKLLEEKKKP